MMVVMVVILVMMVVMVNSYNTATYFCLYLKQLSSHMHARQVMMMK